MKEFLKNRVKEHEKNINLTLREMAKNEFGTDNYKLLKNRLLVNQSWKIECLAIISFIENPDW